MNFLNKIRYNEKPYISKAYYNSQPLKQDLVSILMGLRSEMNIEKSRILEIGCSYGGNIISYAMNFENVEIVGIDLSEVQVEEGNKIISEMGLNNIKLYNLDILDYNNEFGKFDYIICHGVYSWVNDSVKDKILKVIKSSLKENGTAVVSYNTYPGWRNFDVIKDIMKFRIKSLKKRGFEVNHKNEVSYARGAVDFLKSHSINNKELTKYIDAIYTKSDYYIYHDFLEETNTPLYLYEFNRELEKNGLFHVSDTNLIVSNRKLENYDIADDLNRECENNNIAKEQYYDLIFDTSFRYSLITHIDKKNKISKIGTYNKTDIDKLHINAKFIVDNDGNYCLNGEIVKPEYFDFVKELNENYPNTLKIGNIVKKYGEIYYNIILNLILGNKISVFPMEIKIDKDIKMKKIKIKKEFSKCIDVVFENLDKISYSNIFGSNYSKDEILIIKEFETGRSYNEIYNDLKNKYNESFKDILEHIFFNILIFNKYEVLE